MLDAFYSIYFHFLKDVENLPQLCLPYDSRIWTQWQTTSNEVDELSLSMPHQSVNGMDSYILKKKRQPKQIKKSQMSYGSL